MKSPTNTTNLDPMAFLIDQMHTGRAIENQEAAGQIDFVSSDTLPRQIDPESRTALEQAGIKFLGPVEGDDQFQYVTLPDGWKKVPTDHSMWSKLVDSKDRTRGMIFYKAAFYDRSAHMYCSRRFEVHYDFECENSTKTGVSHVKDCGQVVHSTEPVAISDSEKNWVVTDRANKLAEAWLDEHYPEWRDPSKYWD